MSPLLLGQTLLLLLLLITSAAATALLTAGDILGDCNARWIMILAIHKVYIFLQSLEIVAFRVYSLLVLSENAFYYKINALHFYTKINNSFYFCGQ